MATYPPYIPVRGPADAKVLVIGDSPSKKDLEAGTCFSGSGALFFVKEFYAASNIPFHECRAMTALSFWPERGDATRIFHTKTEGQKRKMKLVHGQWVEDRVLADGKRLWTEIDRLRPSQIICLGSVALWFLTGEPSITKWRGSKLFIDRPWGRVRLLPTFHPSAVMRKKEWKNVFRHDLQLAALPDHSWVEPNRNIIVHHELGPLLGWLDYYIDLLKTKAVHLSCDIETRAGYITVVGFASSENSAHVIPFTHFERGNVWTAEEEFQIIRRLKVILEHHDVSGQNFVYDYQYLAKLYGIRPNYRWDSMHMQHVFTTKNLPLTLDFLASLHCEHYVYWKDDGKDFHNTIKTETDQQNYWLYNGLDCCRTFEVVESLRKSLSDSWATPVYTFQQSMLRPALAPMLRGINFDRKKQLQFLSELRILKSHYERWFEKLLPAEWFPLPKTPAARAKYSPWWDSTAKQKDLFYKLLGMTPILERRAGGVKTPTTNDNALNIIGKREPALRPLCEKLQEYRSINLFISLYLDSPPSPEDGRMRTSYDLAGTSTFRLASRKDAFGQGLNLQNITKG